MTFIKVAGIFSATCLALTLSSCSRGFSAANQTTLAAPQQQQAVQVLYVAQRQTVSTYTVNSSDGSMDLVSTVQVASSFSPGAGSVSAFPALNDRFLDVAWWDSTGGQHISVFATDAHGAPQLPAIQILDVPGVEVTIPPNGKFAYWQTPTFEPNTEVGSGTIHVLAIDEATGKLSDTGQQVNDPRYTFGSVNLYGASSDGSILYTLAEVAIDGFTSDSYLQHKMDSQTGNLSQSSPAYGTAHQWGSDSLTTLGPKYAATFFNEVEERQPGATYIKVSSLQDSSQPPITCTNQMSDACLNAGDLRFDASGDFLFVTDVVSNRMRVLRVDAAAKTLHDTGSSFPFTSSAAVYFSPDDKLVYAIADQSAQVHVLKFDPDNGKLTAIGTRQTFAVPYALVPAMRN